MSSGFFTEQHIPITWASLPPPQRCPTLAEEVWAAVKLWYKERGLPVPVNDASVCLKAIADEKKPAPPPVETPSKPSYGSGSFWKAYWDKKKAAGWVPKKVK